MHTHKRAQLFHNTLRDFGTGLITPSDCELIVYLYICVCDFLYAILRLMHSAHSHNENNFFSPPHYKQHSSWSLVWTEYRHTFINRYHKYTISLKTISLEMDLWFKITRFFWRNILYFCGRFYSLIWSFFSMYMYCWHRID